MLPGPPVLQKGTASLACVQNLQYIVTPFLQKKDQRFYEPPLRPLAQITLPLAMTMGYAVWPTMVRPGQQLQMLIRDHMGQPRCFPEVVPRKRMQSSTFAPLPQ